MDFNKKKKGNRTKIESLKCLTDSIEKDKPKSCQLISSFIDVVAVVVRNWTKAIIIVAIHEKNNRTSNIQHSTFIQYFVVNVYSNYCQILYSFRMSFFPSVPFLLNIVLKFQKMKFQLNLLWQRATKMNENKKKTMTNWMANKRNNNDRQQSIKLKNEIFFDIFLFIGLLKWVEDSLHVNNNQNKYGKRR